MVSAACAAQITEGITRRWRRMPGVIPRCRQPGSVSTTDSGIVQLGTVAPDIMHVDVLPGANIGGGEPDHLAILDDGGPRRHGRHGQLMAERNEAVSHDLHDTATALDLQLGSRLK